MLRTFHFVDLAVFLRAAVPFGYGRRGLGQPYVTTSALQATDEQHRQMVRGYDGRYNHLDPT